MIYSFMPKSISGKWAVGFGIALAMMTAISVVFALAIGGDPAVVEANRFLKFLAVILSVGFTLSGPLSLLFGIYTGIRHKEWSVWKTLAILYIFSFLLFLVGDLLFPH